ncbi:MAG: response regulator [Armatimonadota bacterium]
MSVRAFIVDGHAPCRDGLRSLLDQEEGFGVVGEAASGSEAIRLAGRSDVDVLVTEIATRGTPGEDIAAKLLAKRPDLHVVVLTMLEDEHYLRKFLAIGVKGFVLKRSPTQELMRAIRAAIKGQHYVDPALTPHVMAACVSNAAQAAPEEPELLSPRAKEICYLLALGYTSREIARRLQLSPRTVEAHRARLMKKLSLTSRWDIVRYAFDSGRLRPGSPLPRLGPRNPGRGMLGPC